MKVYTVTIDGRPESRTYTMILSLCNAYGLHHRKALTGIKRGKYQVVSDEKYFIIMETELIKCRRRVHMAK